jgi:hypothetical protein
MHTSIQLSQKDHTHLKHLSTGQVDFTIAKQQSLLHPLMELATLRTHMRERKTSRGKNTQDLIT